MAGCASDGIPFIITKCISEIERRALKMKVRKGTPLLLTAAL